MIRLRILPTESRSKVRLSAPRAIKAQRTNLPQLSKTVVREIARKIRTAIWRFLWVCCVHRQTGARRGRIFPGPARSIDFAAQQEGLGALAQRRRRQLEEGRCKLADFVPAESALTTSGGFQAAGEVTQFSCVATEFNRGASAGPR